MFSNHNRILRCESIFKEIIHWIYDSSFYHIYSSFNRRSKNNELINIDNRRYIIVKILYCNYEFILLCSIFNDVTTSSLFNVHYSHIVKQILILHIHNRFTWCFTVMSLTQRWWAWSHDVQRRNSQRWSNPTARSPIAYTSDVCLVTAFSHTFLIKTELLASPPRLKTHLFAYGANLYNAVSPHARQQFQKSFFFSVG